MTENEINKFITNTSLVVDSLRGAILERVKVETGKEYDLDINDLTYDIVDNEGDFYLDLVLNPKGTELSSGRVTRKQVIKEIFPGVAIDVYVGLTFNIGKNECVSSVAIEDCFNEAMTQLTNAYGSAYPVEPNPRFEESLERIKSDYLIKVKNAIKTMYLGEEFKEYDITITHNVHPDYVVFDINIKHQDGTKPITHRCVYDKETIFLNKRVEIHVAFDSVEQHQEFPIIDVKGISSGLDNLSEHLYRVIRDIEREVLCK